MKRILQTTFIIVVVAMLLICFIEKPENTDNNDINKSRHTAITKAIEDCSPAVVGINVTQLKRGQTNLFLDPFWGGFFPRTQTYKVESLGSGFIVSSDGYVITNSHVIEDALEIIVTLPGGKRYTAEMIGSDPPTDLALLKIDGNDFPYVKFGSSDDIMVGEWAIALGNPMGLFDIAKLPTATVGIISGLNMDFGEKESGHIYQDMIQTDASINQGNSGGPLVNSLGEVIGVNTFIITGSGYTTGSIGIGFAIPIYRVKNVMRDLKKFGRVERSFNTGVHLQSIDVYLQRYLNLPTSDGVIITEIERNSAGEDAGLLVGDVILKVDSKIVNRGQDIMRIIGESFKKSGDYITLKIWRENEFLEVKLELREGD